MAWYHRIVNIIRRERVGQDIDRELSFHIAERTDDLVASGISEDEARRMAKRQFGNYGLQKERTRDVKIVGWIESILQDIRYAIRMMRRSPGFTAVAMCSLALGIGMNTAIFSLIDAVLLRSLPVRDPAGLVLLGDARGYGYSTGQQGSFTIFSTELYQHLQKTDVFESLSAVQSSPSARVSVRHPGSRTIEPAGSKLVSGNYFQVLGVNAALGRTIGPQDDSPAAPPVAVVSYDYWAETLNGDPSAVGSTIELNRVSVAIVGVAPPEFYGEGFRPDPPSFWLPISAERHLNPEGRLIEQPNLYWLFLIGRLNPNLSATDGEERLTAVLRSWLLGRAGSAISDQRRRNIAQSYIQITPAGGGVPIGKTSYSTTLRLLLAISGAVLLITCTNIANLLLARGSAREGESSIRVALGASRRRLIQQSLTESMMLALAGGTLALLVAVGGARVFKTLLFTAANDVSIQVLANIRILAFTLALSCAAAVVFGMLPALRLRSQLVAAIRGTTAGIKGSSSWRYRRPRFQVGRALIIAEVALLVVVLAAASSFVRSLEHLSEQQFGFDREAVLVVDVDPLLAGYEYVRLGPLYDQVYARLNALPGVKGAALSYYSPFNGCCWAYSVSVPGYISKPDENTTTLLNRVSRGYFETLGTKLLAGRGFDERDGPESPRVTVVNEAFVHRYFANEDPIGKQFGLDYENNDRGLEIVGVVEDSKYDSPREEPRPMAFLSLLQLAPGESPNSSGYQSNFVNAVVIRAAGDPATIGSDVRQALVEIDPGLPVLRVETLSSHIDRELNQENMIADLAVLFGLLALLVACLGLYGLMAYMVQRRTGEIGIRMALGAQRASVIGMVMREVAVQGLMGVIIGVPAAFAMMRLIANQLYGVSPGDARDPAMAALILLLCITIAGYLPARRASRVDPTAALKHQ